MGYYAAPNCVHIDNWRRCKVHKPHWLIRWMMPQGRPPCILDNPMTPQDGEHDCPDFIAQSRPRPPGPPPPSRND